MKCDFCPNSCHGQLDDCRTTMHMVVSITNRCTRSCDHCFQDAGPGMKSHLSLAHAEAAAELARANQANVQVYGGEIICHPEWEAVLGTLLAGGQACVVHTNGDWVANETLANRFVTVLKNSGTRIEIAVSNDGYHDLARAEAAVRWLYKATGRAETGGRMAKREERHPHLKVLNPFKRDGTFMTAARESYPLLPAGRACALTQPGTRLTPPGTCPYLAQTGGGYLSPTVLPDGRVFNNPCGSTPIGLITDPRDQLAETYRKSCSGEAPMDCDACLKAAGSSCAWRTHYS